MAERVRLRLHNAEEVIAKAKEQAAVREQQLQRLKEKGRTFPPEASLLGCWQVIEKTVTCNVEPAKYPDFKIGQYRTFFTAVTPDGSLFGESVSSGEISFVGRTSRGSPETVPVRWGTSTFEITGRIVSEGVVRYRELPLEGKEMIGNTAFSSEADNYYPGPRQNFGMRQIPRLLEAKWQGYEMEGKSHSGLGEVDFKAVRIENQIWI
jgi:hypothetical protein